MALGLARWLAGGGAEAVPMTEQGEGKKVKRRRRKETPAGEQQFSLPNQMRAENTGEVQHFPGMVNLSGTLCYMNSVLQVGHCEPSRSRH
jgi:ubiquitin carboxyl-terminal hydrolase 1